LGSLFWQCGRRTARAPARRCRCASTRAGASELGFWQSESVVAS